MCNYIRNSNWFNNKLLSLMKPNSFLVNTSRGGVIEEKILFKMLQEKRIAGAALDVFWQEPLPPGSPWRKLPNVILTPHIAGWSFESSEKMARILAGKIIGLKSFPLWSASSKKILFGKKNLARSSLNSLRSILIEIWTT